MALPVLQPTLETAPEPEQQVKLPVALPVFQPTSETAPEPEQPVKLPVALPVFQPTLETAPEPEQQGARERVKVHPWRYPCSSPLWKRRR